MQALSTGIYDKLSGDTGAGGVYTLTSGRIYELQGPQDAALPLVVYTVMNNPPWTTFQKNHLKAEVQIDAFGLVQAGAAAVRTIADRVFTLLHQQSLTVSGFVTVECLCSDRGVGFVEEDVVHIVTRWRVTGTSTA